MDKRLQEGIDLFNKGKYYECHDVLEGLWKETNNEYKDLYKGLIHLAVAMYLLGQNRLSGAIKRFSSGKELLSPYLENTTEINIKELIDTVTIAVQRIE